MKFQGESSRGHQKFQHPLKKIKHRKQMRIRQKSKISKIENPSSGIHFDTKKTSSGTPVPHNHQLSSPMLRVPEPWLYIDVQNPIIY